MKFDPYYHKYKSKRNLIFSKNGMVATTHPLASEVGVDIMKKGGNAIDAAIGVAAALTVVEPTSNGIGGDAFALIWKDGKLHGINGSGFSPGSITLEGLRERGLTSMPTYGLIPVNVPGVPATWAELSRRFGDLTLLDALNPAIEIAREGYPLSPTVAERWEIAFNKYTRDLKGEEFAPWFKLFAPKGRAPRPGEVWKSDLHADSLEAIGKSNGRDFYEGDLAQKIHNFSKKYKGYISLDDLKAYKPQWVDPISVNYRGYDVWEIPPNGHGLVTLMTLNILKNFDLGQRDSLETQHILMESLKLAYADGLEYIADDRFMEYTTKDLLSPDYGRARANLIGKAALSPTSGRPERGGTVYFAVADSKGNMVSYIQSNYQGFGSGIVIPETGIALHNRGKNFNMLDKHPNCIGPSKKPYHTIIPGFLTKDNEPVGPFGVMGAFMQPQGQVQMVTNTIDFHLNPQDSLDAPRWQWLEGKTISLEQDYPNDLALGLQRRGHNIIVDPSRDDFGRGQIIWKDKDGILVGGTEPRADGHISIY